MKILIHHLPKTAGTSLHTMLDGALWKERLDELEDGAAPDPDVVHSHRPYMQLVREWPGRLNLTIVREPIYRTVSYHRWLAGNRGNDAATVRKFSQVRFWIDAIERAVSDPTEFAEFYSKYESNPYVAWYNINNRMTVQLGSDHVAGGGLTPQDFDVSPLEECFERACANLSSMHWFGFHDTIKKDVVRLSDMLGRPLEFPWANASTHPAQALNRKDHERLREVNEWDIKLYEFAKSL